MNSMFKRVALVARHSKPQVVASLISLADFLTTHGLTVLVDRDSVSHADAGRYPLVDRADLGKLADLAIVLGGDGTMLSVARLLAPYNTPMVGVNQGRLGFMTDISLHEMFTTIEAILHGEFVPEDRILLNASVQRDGVEVASTLAFNDVVFSRGATGSMIEFEIFIDKQFVYSQRSDGLIVSTPTGSTAYSLAAGGPILQASLRAFTLVPICPQSMTNRPIAVSDTCEIEILVTKAADARLHFDGQSFVDVQNLDRINIRRYRHSLRVLHPSDYQYYKTLRQKLHWGEQLI